MLSLTPFYAGWSVYQRRLSAALASLTSDQLALSLPHHWQIGRIVAHSIGARVWWLHSQAGEGNADLEPMESWDNKAEPLREASELVHGFERSWQIIAEALASWSVADLSQVLPACSDDPNERTKGWIIWHLAEHNMFHGGEIHTFSARTISPPSL